MTTNKAAYFFYCYMNFYLNQYKICPKNVFIKRKMHAFYLLKYENTLISILLQMSIQTANFWSSFIENY